MSGKSKFIMKSGGSSEPDRSGSSDFAHFVDGLNVYVTKTEES
jgi:hypothetical protein